MTKTADRDQTEALGELRKLLRPGTTVYTILRHVSSSGMSRRISCVIVTGGKLRSIDWLVGRATHYKQDRNNEGLRVGGAGMDMGFELVYTLSRALYPKGYKCSGNDGTGRGQRCLSNDHVNYRHHSGGSWDEERAEWVGREVNPEPNYLKGKRHSDGGYALKQEWI